MEGKVAVLGDSDFVLPFSAMGLDTFAVECHADVVAETAQKIIDEKYMLVVVAENIAELAEETFYKTIKKPVPCVVVVPFTAEPTGIATRSLSRVLKLATGIDILNN